MTTHNLPHFITANLNTESQRAMDDQNNWDFSQEGEMRTDRAIYAQEFGESIAYYTDFILSQNDYGSLSTITNPLVTPSDSILANNAEFAGLDKKMGDNRVYFIGGAGNDKDGWNYINRWDKAFEKSGIDDFVRVNASFGKNGDVIFTALNKDSTVKNLESMISVQSVANTYINNLKLNPLDSGEQFNLAGYSYGSVMQAQVALNLASRGYVIDNLILIGSPISTDSELYKLLDNNKNIKNIVRQDIKGDGLSNTKTSTDFISGGINAIDIPYLTDGDSAHHFDLARPGSEADKNIQNAVTNIKNNGVRN